MFCLQSSLNGSASNLPDGAGRSFATSFSGQSGVASPVFHHSGGDILLESILFLLPLVISLSGSCCRFYSGIAQHSWEL